jgi:hypothetical protein
MAAITGMQWRRTSTHVKLTGDFGNVIAAMRLGDRFRFCAFAKNSQPCNFRLLQHYLPIASATSGDHWLLQRRCAIADCVAQVSTVLTSLQIILQRYCCTSA